MPPRRLDRKTFERRYRSAFIDPAFDGLQDELEKVTAAAWDAYDNGRKSPRTTKAGSGYADPAYELATDWLRARDAIVTAQAQYNDKQSPAHVLLINGSSRTEHTCLGEMSKSWRLLALARDDTISDIQVETLDLAEQSPNSIRTPRCSKKSATRPSALPRFVFTVRRRKTHWATENSRSSTLVERQESLSLHSQASRAALRAGLRRFLRRKVPQWNPETIYSRHLPPVTWRPRPF